LWSAPCGPLMGVANNTLVMGGVVKASPPLEDDECNDDNEDAPDEDDEDEDETSEATDVATGVNHVVVVVSVVVLLAADADVAMMLLYIKTLFV
jgi:hypothetical protein